MVNQMAESPQSLSSNLRNTESIGEAAIVLISIGSILVIICAAAVIYGLRRRRHVSTTMGGVSSLTEEGIHNPTDFMHSLATWDHSYPIDEMLEKRRRSVWNLEIFENYSSSENKTESKLHSET